LHLAVEVARRVETTFPCVIPAKAGIQGTSVLMCEVFWIPAFAGMTHGEGGCRLKSPPINGGKPNAMRSFSPTMTLPRRTGEGTCKNKKG